MGRLYLPAQVFDADGDPLSGAKMYTYDAAATTTPKETFSDAALTTARANPVVADAAGRFGDIFAETGESFYCVLTTSGDVPVAAFSNVDAMGEASGGELARTFVYGRWRVSSGDTGSGNDGILVEYGQLSPTNTGGYVKESGWDETQGGKKIVDFAQTEFTGGITFTGSTKQNAAGVTASDIDVSSAEVFTKSISSNTTFTFSNATTGKAQGFILILTISSSAVPTWPASVDWPGGVSPTLPNGEHVLGFITPNGGTNWKGFVGGLSFS